MNHAERCRLIRQKYRELESTRADIRQCKQYGLALPLVEFIEREKEIKKEIMELSD